MQELFEIPEEYEAMLKKGIGLTGNDKHFFIRGRLDLLENKTSLKNAPKRILDFGCGTGATSENLLQRFPTSEIVGSDLSDAALNFAREKIQNQNIRFIALDKLQEEAEFDLIYLNCVIHHVPVAQRQAVIDQLFSLLSATGTLWIFENNPANPGTRWAMYRNPFDKGVVKIWPFELKKLLQNAGLKTEAAYFIFYFPQWLSWFRPLEKFFLKIPMGGQYALVAQKFIKAPDQA
jgi:ubiquinone/menaquinone biosynthesis C-methylase UbiE